MALVVFIKKIIFYIKIFILIIFYFYQGDQHLSYQNIFYNHI